MKLPKQYVGLNKGFRFYWKVFGGWAAVFVSPYFALSLVATGGMFPLWLQPGWWESPLSILPNIVSFSLGGFAILLAFGDERFRSLISGEREAGKASPYLVFAATFMHFILLQILALFAALFAKAWFQVPVHASEHAIAFNSIARSAFWAFGFGLFVYSLFAAIAAVMAIFVLVRSFDTYASHLRNEAAKAQDDESSNQ